MGTKTTFTKRIRWRRSPTVPRTSFLSLVDGSYILHSVMRLKSLGYQCFKLDPTDSAAIQALVLIIVAAILRFVHPLGNWDLLPPIHALTRIDRSLSG